MKYVTELVSFGLAVPLLLYAGLSPALEGRPVNAIFLGFAAVAVVLLVAVYRKSRRESQ